MALQDANGIYLKTGDRVAVLPHSWLFLAGAHHGTVVKTGRTKVHVEATINGVTYALNPSSVSVVLMAPWLGAAV